MLVPECDLHKPALRAPERATSSAIVTIKDAKLIRLKEVQGGGSHSRLWSYAREVTGKRRLQSNRGGGNSGQKDAWTTQGLATRRISAHGPRGSWCWRWHLSIWSSSRKRSNWSWKLRHSNGGGRQKETARQNGREHPVRSSGIGLLDSIASIPQQQQTLRNEHDGQTGPVIVCHQSYTVAVAVFRDLAKVQGGQGGRQLATLCVSSSSYCYSWGYPCCRFSSIIKIESSSSTNKYFQSSFGVEGRQMEASFC